MPLEELKKNELAKREPAPHNVFIEGREALRISGVEDVESFDESEIVLYTSRGKLIVQGRDLRISLLQVHTGELEVQGTVNALGYSGDERAKGGFWSRLFG